MFYLYNFKINICPFLYFKPSTSIILVYNYVIFSYWDPTYDQDLIEDRIAMNLIYVQVNAIHISRSRWRSWLERLNSQLRMPRSS